MSPKSYTLDTAFPALGNAIRMAVIMIKHSIVLIAEKAKVAKQATNHPTKPDIYPIQNPR